MKLLIITVNIIALLDILDLVVLCKKIRASKDLKELYTIKTENDTNYVYIRDVKENQEKYRRTIEDKERHRIIELLKFEGYETSSKKENPSNKEFVYKKILIMTSKEINPKNIAKEGIDFLEFSWKNEFQEMEINIENCKSHTFNKDYLFLTKIEHFSNISYIRFFIFIKPSEIKYLNKENSCNYQFKDHSKSTYIDFKSIDLNELKTKAENNYITAFIPKFEEYIKVDVNNNIEFLSNQKKCELKGIIDNFGTQKESMKDIILNYFFDNLFNSFQKKYDDKILLAYAIFNKLEIFAKPDSVCVAKN